MKTNSPLYLDIAMGLVVLWGIWMVTYSVIKASQPSWQSQNLPNTPYTDNSVPPLLSCGSRIQCLGDFSKDNGGYTPQSYLKDAISMCHDVEGCPSSKNTYKFHQEEGGCVQFEDNMSHSSCDENGYIKIGTSTPYILDYNDSPTSVNLDKTYKCTEWELGTYCVRQPFPHYLIASSTPSGKEIIYTCEEIALRYYVDCPKNDQPLPSNK